MSFAEYESILLEVIYLRDNFIFPVFSQATRSVQEHFPIDDISRNTVHFYFSDVNALSFSIDDILRNTAHFRLRRERAVSFFHRRHLEKYRPLFLLKRKRAVSSSHPASM